MESIEVEGRAPIENFGGFKIRKIKYLKLK